MTQLQIQWQNMRLAEKELAEKKRANRVSEFETNRSNLAREMETHRTNVTNERETNRANQAREAETNRSNLANEELKRQANVETHRANVANEGIRRDTNVETHRSNLENESIKRQQNAETERANQAKEINAALTLLETERANREAEKYYPARYINGAWSAGAQLAMHPEMANQAIQSLLTEAPKILEDSANTILTKWLDYDPKVVRDKDEIKFEFWDLVFPSRIGQDIGDTMLNMAVDLALSSGRKLANRIQRSSPALADILRNTTRDELINHITGGNNNG